MTRCFYKYLLCLSSTLFALLLLIVPTHSTAQSSIGLRFVFGTIHPYGNSQARYMPNKLDKNAYMVPNWGVIASYQKYFYKKRWSIKFAQGAYSDCAALFAGHTHLGFRLNVLNGGRHYLEVGFGPTFAYRQSWYRFEGYEQQTGLLKTTGDWQWNFVWYGGEIEYDYRISRNLDMNVNVIPGIPDFLTFAIGVRYWFRPLPSNRDWPDSSPKMHILH